MPYALELIRTPDGRELEVARLGTEGGVPVVFHHGSPGSCATALSLEAMGLSHGLDILTSSRAGYGHSSARPGRDVAAVVSDVAALRAHFGVGDYVAVGWSGGGPHALACASLDEHCRGAISLAGVAPIDADFDWTEGMAPENVEEFILAREGGAAYVAHMQATAEQFARASAMSIVDLFGELLSDVDRAALEPQAAREILAQSCREAFARSAEGYIDDDRAFFAAWGFDLGSISRPVQIWYGDNDLMVPASHGAWLARAIPTASAVHLPADGHLSLVAAHQGELGVAITHLWGPA